MFQVNQALSVRCTDTRLWSRLYQKRWKTCFGIPKGALPTREQYVQRARVVGQSYRQSRSPQYSGETYCFSLQVSEFVAGGQGVIVFEGQQEVALRDDDTQLQPIRMRNSARQVALDCSGQEMIRAVLMIARQSDQAMALVWDTKKDGWGRCKHNGSSLCSSLYDCVAHFLCQVTRWVTTITNCQPVASWASCLQCHTLVMVLEIMLRAR